MNAFDRQTERRTDRILVARPRLHIPCSTVKIAVLYAVVVLRRFSSHIINACGPIHGYSLHVSAAAWPHLILPQYPLEAAPWYITRFSYATLTGRFLADPTAAAAGRLRSLCAEGWKQSVDWLISLWANWLKVLFYNMWRVTFYPFLYKNVFLDPVKLIGNRCCMRIAYQMTVSETTHVVILATPCHLSACSLTGRLDRHWFRWRHSSFYNINNSSSTNNKSTRRSQTSAKASPIQILVQRNIFRKIFMKIRSVVYTLGC